MTKFKFTFYHILYEKDQNSFETIFNEAKKQLEIYKRQFDLTLRTYKKEWDGEIAERNEAYKNHKEKAEQAYKNAIDGSSRDEFTEQYAMHVSGLDFIIEEHSIDIEKINVEYNNFLDLYSKSILIAIYSLNENKLNEIAETAASVFLKKIKPAHFNSRDYLESSLQYLNLVTDIEIVSLEKYTSKLKELQFLRNKIIHNGSKFSDVQQVSKIVKKHQDLDLDDKKQLKIKGSKFIKDIFELFSDFYQSLFWLIDLKQDSVILKNGFKHWLGILDREVIIEQLTPTTISNSEKNIYIKAIFKNFKPSLLEFKITIKKGNPSFTYTNQTDDEVIEDFIGFENDISGKTIYEIFDPLMVTRNYQIKVILF